MNTDCHGLRPLIGAYVLDTIWGISAEVDLRASDEQGVAVLTVTDVGQLRWVSAARRTDASS